MERKLKKTTKRSERRNGKYTTSRRIGPLGKKTQRIRKKKDGKKKNDNKQCITKIREQQVQ